MDLRTHSDYFPIQHELIGFYNRDRGCSLRGRNWVVIYKTDMLRLQRVNWAILIICGEALKS
jgi:hypothetical protein